MYGLIPLGIFHLAVSLVALGTGAFLLLRDKEITSSSLAGRIYIFATIVTCATALGIYQHGRFGNAHVLAILTLIVLGLAVLAGNSGVFGAKSRIVAAVAYSATFLFHLIPAFAEAFTRLPLGSPLAGSAEDPLVKIAHGILLLLFLIGAVRQVKLLQR